MSAVSYGSFISAKHLQDLGFCMIGLGTLFTIVRFAIRIVKRRFWLLEDVIVLLAWACLFALCAGYIKVTPAVYRIAAVGNGQTPPYPTLEKDIEFLLKVFFPGTLLLWCCLWLVKVSLLLNCRRLIDRQPGYIVTWWWIVGTVIITFIGCVITELTSCRTLHDWFTPGQCATERDARASTISLFYAFAVDILTDLMIMFFPLRVLWNLQLSRLRKYSIMALFCVVVLGICASVVRVVQIRGRSGSRQPSPSWLEVWAMVEAAIAVVVACLPSFGLLLSPMRPSKYGSNSLGKSKSSGTAKQCSTALEDRKTSPGPDHVIVKNNHSRTRLTKCAPLGVLVTTTVRSTVETARQDIPSKESLHDDSEVEVGRIV